MKGLGSIEVTMRDGSVWRISINEVAVDRAKYYAHEFDGSLERSLKEDTLPLFESSHHDIIDWAENNMNWSDFKNKQRIREPSEANYGNEWCENEKQVIWSGNVEWLLTHGIKNK